MQVLLAAWFVVWALDANLLSGCNGAREDSAEGVESALVRSGDHLRNIHHQRTCRITATDALGCGIIHRALVQVLHSVLLSCSGGRQLGHNHGQQGVGGVDPNLHGSLHQGLSSEGFLITLQDNAQGAHHLLILLLVIIHDGTHKLIDWAHDKLAEGTLQRLSAAFWLLHIGPDLLLGIEEGVTPHALHHLFLLNTHLLRIDLGKSLSGEAPSMQTAAKCDSTLLRLHLHITHQRIIVGGNNHVHILNGIAETRVHVLCFHLQLQNATVHFVHKQAGPHTLLKSLAQHSLGLDSTALNAINDHHRTIGDSKSCSHFRGEVDVTWGVNQVDQVRNSSLAILLIVFEVQGHSLAGARV